MGIGKVGYLASPWRPLDEAFFYQERFIDLLERAGVFAQRGGDGRQSDGTALKLVYHRRQELVVNLVQAIAVNVQRFEGIAGNRLVDATAPLHLGKVAHAAEQGVGDTRRAATPRGNLFGRSLLAGDIQYLRTAEDDVRQRLVVVVFQMHVDAEAGTERTGQQAAAGRRADEGEGCEVDLDRTRARSLVYHNINAIVLHRRVKIFLDDRTEAVNLVDKKHIVLLERGQDACQVARLIQHRTGGNLEAHAQLVGNDVRERCLSQTWRPVEQYMVQRFLAHPGSHDEDTEVLHHFRLAAEVAEGEGA